MKTLLLVLAVLHVATLPPLIAESSADNAGSLSLHPIEGDYILITVDEASEGNRTFPISVPVRITNPELERWELEILGDELPAELGAIPIVHTPRSLPSMPGTILFQTIHAPGARQFSTTVFTGFLGDPDFIKGRYYRIPGSGRAATEGRFTLQRKK